MYQMPRVWNEFGYMPAYPVEVADPKHAAAYAVFVESMKYLQPRPACGMAENLEGHSGRDPVDADRTSACGTGAGGCAGQD